MLRMAMDLGKYPFRHWLFNINIKQYNVSISSLYNEFIYLQFVPQWIILKLDILYYEYIPVNMYCITDGMYRHDQVHGITHLLFYYIIVLAMCMTKEWKNMKIFLTSEYELVSLEISSKISAYPL